VSKTIWIFSCYNESGDRWVCGYFNKKPTEKEQHAYFKKNYNYEYACTDDGEDDPVCYIHWDLVELNREKLPPPLPKKQWSRSL